MRQRARFEWPYRHGLPRDCTGLRSVRPLCQYCLHLQLQKSFNYYMAKTASNSSPTGHYLYKSIPQAQIKSGATRAPSRSQLPKRAIVDPVPTLTTPHGRPSPPAYFFRCSATTGLITCLVIPHIVLSRWSDRAPSQKTESSQAYRPLRTCDSWARL